MLTGYVVAELRLGLVDLNWTFVFQIMNTLILYFLLKKFLFVPVTEFMQNRENEIANAFEEAEIKNEEAENLREEYKIKLMKAEDESREISKQIIQKSENKSTEIIKDAKNEAHEIKVRANKDIEREKVKAINSLKDDIASMAILAASKVVEKDINEDDHRIIIDKFIDEVGDTKWQN
ncbi:MAG: ATP synthase F0 subunit B [Bacteroidetes bacterium 4572_77]|nr:MAG: ATP synthase F0 subunit B [Bacteroidetes bacterium 4572_77]